MSDRDWKLEVLRKLASGERFRVTERTQMEAKEDFRQFVRYLMSLDLGTKVWMAHGANGNLNVELVGGGRVWFDSYAHPPRPGITEY